MNWKLPTLIACLSVAALNYTISDMSRPRSDTPPGNPTIFVTRFKDKPDAEGFPAQTSWEKAPSLRFEHDWRGENPDAERETEVRLLWTPETLFLRFHCRYRNLTLFPDARADGWRDKLWERDVAETFLQPDTSDPLVYTEFEVSPNGSWIDLAVSHGKIEELHSSLRRRASIDEKSRTWTAELAIPVHRLDPHFDPKNTWRGNFFRIEGEGEARFYSAWSPTHSPKPNFHVPAAFGTLVFHE